MLELSDTSISDTTQILGRHGLEAAFLVPTVTGLNKSIMDATMHVREFLRRNKIHDYAMQEQGTSAKVMVPAKIVTSHGVVDTEASLYRPETKDGDPRIWIYGLKKFANPANLFALIADKGTVYVVNCSVENLEAMITNNNLPLAAIAASATLITSVPEELLYKLKKIGSRGFIRTMRPGDTGVGYTLETLLGIDANSNKAPDYKGIEIKSGRMAARQRAAARGRITLFSQIPNRNISPYSAVRAINEFGYHNPDKNRMQLYCSVEAAKANSLGLKLGIDTLNLAMKHPKAESKDGSKDVFRWVLEEIRTSFSNKHKETFWVGARRRINDRAEEFHYQEVRHTRKPFISVFDRLLETGGIGVDLTMYLKPSGNGVRDHGYLFRVFGEKFDELFPLVAVHDISGGH